MRLNRRTVIRARSMPDVVAGILRFELRALVVTVLASAIILAAFPVTTPAVHAAEPKVVIVVGPVGSKTDAYRADGDRAAKAARAAGATVEKIYSPDATWPRVREALQGASLVVYLGHGNGWPSKYRSSPFAKTQNGMGLNPEAGAGDSAHQYFGELYLARDVRLAPHAVVLLSHLCYASGNSEPGLPEGDLDTAKQRVDNYAAGWLAAGAEAVLAEGLGSPEYYVRRILAGNGTIDAIWRRGPTAHGHVLAFPSVRTPGMTALMDPTHNSSGFYRSLVGRVRMRADEVARGAVKAAPHGGSFTTAATPVGPGIKDVTLKGIPTAGSSLRVTVTLDKASRRSARSLGIGIRWDPLLLDPEPLVTELAGAGAGPEASPAPEASPMRTAKPVPSAGPASSPIPSVPTAPAPSAEALSAASPGVAGSRRADASKTKPASPAPPAGSAATPPASPAPAASPTRPPDQAASAAAATGTPPDAPPDAPPISLISPEVPGTLVNVSDVMVKGARVSADVVVPQEPGLYRLVVTIHDEDGVAFDATTQERVPSFTVSVTGELSTVVSAIDRLSTVAGGAIDLPVSVVNTGHVSWIADQSWKPDPGSPSRPEHNESSAVLVGQWVRLDGSGVAMEALAARAMVTPPPGATEQVILSFSAPQDTGSYLLILDVVSPLYGSLAAVGGTPMVVRVEVTSPEVEDAPTGSPGDLRGDAAPSRVD